MNPCAGQKKARKYLADIIDIFNRAGYTVTTHITERTGDGETAVIRYAPEMDLVVCCGGDGTFNETISGVLKSGQDIPIGYIPAGSTNDFAASLCLSSDILQAARDMGELHTVVSVITAGNEASTRLHEEFGFTYCGRVIEAGVKFGKYLGIDTYQMIL